MTTKRINHNAGQQVAWGAQAFSLLVAAFCRDELSELSAPHPPTPRRQKSVSAACRNQQAESLRSPDASARDRRSYP
jgi:hypothetical protein